MDAAKAPPSDGIRAASWTIDYRPFEAGSRKKHTTGATKRTHKIVHSEILL